MAAFFRDRAHEMVVKVGMETVLLIPCALYIRKKNKGEREGGREGGREHLLT